MTYALEFFLTSCIFLWMWSSVFGFYASFILLECRSIYTCPLQIYIFVVLRTFHIFQFYGHKNKKNLLKSCVGSITFFTPKEKGRKPQKKIKTPLEVSSFILDLVWIHCVFFVVFDAHMWWNVESLLLFLWLSINKYPSTIGSCHA